MVARMRAAANIRAASTYLTRFDAPEPANDPHEAMPPTAAPVEPSDASPESPLQTMMSDLKAQVEPPPVEAEYPSAADMAAEIDARILAAREEERLDAEARLLQARETWSNDIASAIAGQIDAAIHDAFSVLRDDLARALTPFISREVFSHTFDQMLSCIKKGLAGEAEPVIEIFAPADLIEKLKRALVDRNIAIIAHESDQTEMRVQMGATVIETALEEWLSRLTDKGKGAS